MGTITNPEQGVVGCVMPRHITDQELERMVEFANTPTYLRKPEQLLPQDEE